MESFDTSEASLCKGHLPFIKKGDMVIFDRYYASYELMAVLSGKGASFLFRMRQKSWTCVDEFMTSKEEEKIVTLKLPKKCEYLLEAYAQLTTTLTIRLIKKRNRKGEVHVFATSLLDTDQYSKKSIIHLYKQRWGIEEAYKLIKARLEVADFSGKTLQAVQQDFYAKTMLLSLSAALSFKVALRIKRLPSRKKKNTKARKRMINRTFALYGTKKIIQQLHRDLETLSEIIEMFISKIQNKIEYSRKGQAVERKIKKGISTMHAMSYKVV
jgi:macrodomain Ter protein organizer (MatP/YcbG family)